MAAMTRLFVTGKSLSMVPDRIGSGCSANAFWEVHAGSLTKASFGRGERLLQRGLIN